MSRSFIQTTILTASNPLSNEDHHSWSNLVPVGRQLAPEMIIFDGPLNITSTVERIIGLYRPFTGPDGDKSSSGTWNRFVHLVEKVNIALYVSY